MKPEALRALVDDANDLLYSHDLDGVLLWVNKTAGRMLGVPAEDLVGRRIQEFLTPASLETALDQIALKAAGATEASEPYELELVRADGRSLWVEISSRLQRDSQGRPASIHGIGRDVTQRREAQRGLELVRRLSVELNDAADVEDALGTIVRSVCEAAGWPYGEAWVAEGGRLHATEAVYMARRELGRFRRASRQAEYRPGQGLLGTVWKEGQRRWVADVSSEPLFHLGANALSVGLRGIVAVPVIAEGLSAVLVWMQEAPRQHDAPWVHAAAAVTSQLASVVAKRRVEDRLRWQAAVLEGQLEAVDYAVMVVSEAGEVMAANQRLMELCRVHPLQRHVAGHGPVADTVDRPERFLDTARFLYEDPGEGDTVELRGRRFRRVVQRIMDEDELPLGRVVMLEDITEGTARPDGARHALRAGHHLAATPPFGNRR